MTLDALRDAIDRRVAEQGLRPLAAAIGIPVGRLRSLLDQRDISASTIDALVNALGWEFYVGPPRSQPPESPANTGTSVARGDPVRDRDLAELIALLADDWEAADERRRGAILYVMREQLRLRGGAPASRVAAWLGWREVDGGRA